MSLQLYGQGSSRSFRCLWALEEAGLDYTFHGVALGSNEENGTQHPTYLAINPQGKVPSLVDGDFVLTESAAIVNYINNAGNADLIPTQAKQRARYDELSFFILAELEQPLWSNGKHRFALPEEQRIDSMLETAAWEFKKALNAFEILFPFEQYALNNTFSMADVLLAHTFNWADSFGFDVPDKYISYRDRLFDREAAQRALSVIA